MSDVDVARITSAGERAAGFGAAAGAAAGLARAARTGDGERQALEAGVLATVAWGEPFFQLVAAVFLASALALAASVGVSYGSPLNGGDGGQLAAGAVAVLTALVAGRLSVRLEARARRTVPPKVDMLSNLLLSYKSAAAIYALITTGVMDALPMPEEEGASAAELARRSHIKGGSRQVQGLLNLLASASYIEERWSNAEGAARTRVYRHTTSSRELRSDGKGRAFAMIHFSPQQVRSWWRLREALSEGSGGAVDTEPFRLEHGGQGVFEFYADEKNAEAAQHYSDFMMELGTMKLSSGSDTCVGLIAALPLWDQLVTTAVATSSLEASPHLPVVVDIGGGLGHMLGAVLARHPALQGTLFDRPDVVSSPSLCPDLEDSDVARRVVRIGGDLFEGASFPCDADVYVLKWILHDWSDARCATILQRVRAAAEQATQASSLSPWRGVAWRPKVLIVEALTEESQVGRSEDVEMWVIYGGRERTVSEYSAMLWEAGFATTKVTPLADAGFVAIEAELV